MFLLTFFSIYGCHAPKSIEADKWDKVELSFTGPETSEADTINPFTDYRMNVTFSLGEKKYTVPGYFAADGNAAESSATAGAIWKVVFRPDEVGTWTYMASFRKGANIAVDPDPEAGEALAFDGQTGKINVKESLASLPDLRAKGRLNYVGGRYLQFQETGEYFLKGGADSPENLLGYADFDGTYKGSSPEERSGEAENKAQLHRYEAHAQDWKTGDPAWQGGKGKNLIGAINYLASKGINSVYFLTMNIEGDGKDVWPYTSYEERLRFDCSKLAQWEVVFDHMEKLGLMLHIVTQETENELLLDNGDTGLQRKLYYRELVARFGHHLAITWNMGEENGPADFTPKAQTVPQQKAMSAYLQSINPYQNFLAIHTHAAPQPRYEIFDQLLGDAHIDGPSIQIHNMRDAHTETLHWTKASAEAGHPWVVCIDEIGPAHRGVDPDDRADHNQDTVRSEVLWGNLMAGGGGAEWYFGYKNHNNDLGAEDWRSRDRMWDYTSNTLRFFERYVPFWEMEPRDELVTQGNYCLAKASEYYLVYLPYGGTSTLDLLATNGEFTLRWFNPRTGGELQQTDIGTVSGGAVIELGSAPQDGDKDWAILLTKNQ
ncbi:MAG: DUF5060 domain-containing protein [Cyclobacteriaceae bacterium]|nr:DUF5060 domain-containing protein [Cyclobacteriaceae bacterium]